jgi:hypothetical protein
MPIQELTSVTSTNVGIRTMCEADLAEADRIFHLAFGTFLGLPDPMQFYPDRDYIRARYHADPESTFVAEVDGELFGSNAVTNPKFQDTESVNLSGA